MPEPHSLATAPTQLLDLIAQVRRSTDRRELLGTLLVAAMKTTGAGSGAILERGSGDSLTPVLEMAGPLGQLTAGPTLPDPLVIRDLQSPLWAVLLGRTTLTWTTREDSPPPIGEVVGWDSGVVLRMNARRGTTRLLAVGGLAVPTPADLALLQGMADVAAASLDGLELARAAKRSDAVLSTITDLAGKLGAAVSPQQLLAAITRGLGDLSEIKGARIWEVTAAGTHRLVAGDRDGVMPSADLTERRLRALASPTVTPSVRTLVEAGSRSGPDSPLVTLATMAGDPQRVLGIAHNEPLSDLSRSVLRSLLSAIGPAMRKVEVAAERRSLLSRYTHALYPGTRPAGLDIAVELHPNTSAPGSFGGDFFDWFVLPDGRAAIALGDVAGKGIGAASAASMVVWSLRALVDGSTGPVDLVQRLAQVVEQRLDSERFVTLALLVLDPRTWECELVLSGHPTPAVTSAGSGRWVDATANPPLGLISAPIAQPTQFSLAPGETVVLFTDGVTDAGNPDGERYGSDRVLSRACRVSAKPGIAAEEMAAELWYSVHAWAGGAPDDDCAVLVVHRPG